MEQVCVLRTGARLYSKNTSSCSQVQWAAWEQSSTDTIHTTVLCTLQIIYYRWNTVSKRRPLFALAFIFKEVSEKQPQSVPAAHRTRSQACLTLELGIPEEFKTWMPREHYCSFHSKRRSMLDLNQPPSGSQAKSLWTESLLPQTSSPAISSFYAWSDSWWI